MVVWGDNSYGESTAPAGLSNVVAIAAGSVHSLALKSNGTVVGWGYDFWGQVTPPRGLSNVIAIAAGTDHSLALKSDGTVVGWGGDSLRQATPPAGLANVVAIAAGGADSLAIVAQPSLQAQSDGTNRNLVVHWPLWADGFSLEMTENLPGTSSWVPVGVVPVVVNSQYTLTNPFSATSRFYRLRKGF